MKKTSPKTSKVEVPIAYCWVCHQMTNTKAVPKMADSENQHHRYECAKCGFKKRDEDVFGIPKKTKYDPCNFVSKYSKPITQPTTVTVKIGNEKPKIFELTCPNGHWCMVTWTFCPVCGKKVMLK